MTGIHGRGAISRRFSPKLRVQTDWGDGGFIHSSQATCAHQGSLCSTYYLQHAVSIFATPCGRFLKWLEYWLTVTSLIHIDVEADLEHQDWAAAQFPPEEEQVHNRLFSVPKRASFESLNLFGQENDYSDDLEDDPFDEDEEARGRVRRGNELRERERENDGERNLKQKHVFFCLKCWLSGIYNSC